MMNTTIRCKGKTFDLRFDLRDVPPLPPVLEAVAGRLYGRTLKQRPLPGAADAFVVNNDDGVLYLCVRGSGENYEPDLRWTGSLHRRQELAVASPTTFFVEYVPTCPSHSVDHEAALREIGEVVLRLAGGGGT